MQLAHKIIGSGEPLVILHGLFGSLDNWQTLAGRFGESRTCVLVDLRNHGRSPHTDTHSYREMADDLAAFLEANWIHTSDVLGHSMGAKVAMRFALDYPERVERLVCVDMGVRAYARGHDEIFAAMHSLGLDGSLTRAELDEQLAARVPEMGVRQFLLKNLRRTRDGYAWKLNLEVLARDYAEILEPIGGAGATWPGPALFVRGGASDYIRNEDWPGIQAVFPEAELATVTGAGHWVHAEQPEALYTVVEEFLRRGRR